MHSSRHVLPTNERRTWLLSPISAISPEFLLVSRLPSGNEARTIRIVCRPLSCPRTSAPGISRRPAPASAPAPAPAPAPVPAQELY